MAKEDRALGTSTEPGANYMDKVQKGTEKMNVQKSVEVDKAAVEFLEPGQLVEEEPKQVESDWVIFVPHKDFEARVNRDVTYFRKDVPHKVTRDVANMLTEDRARGYLKD